MVLTFIEQHEGTLKKVSFEALLVGFNSPAITTSRSPRHYWEMTSPNSPVRSPGSALNM